MKILAVRGKNLASLAGHFELDFTKPPLDRAGLIAITGPTGAGKTTLLDAMCLALFDRTPRFGNRGGVVIGGVSDDPGGGIKANDVRGILRHGAVEGWAEVDFLGVDDRRWRARWEVRRARGRAEGRLQQQQMQLIDPVSERVVSGDRKLDVLEAIEGRLGLDFDQFRRSVLLAQGEFAAFLEAGGNERAELLERMTGTGLYRQLGRAAFERAKHEELELALVRREREQLRVLPEAERAQLEGELGERQAAAAQLERRRAEAEAAQRWYAREAELAETLTHARAEADRLAEARAAQAETEALLIGVERLAGLRERIDTRDRLAAELADRSRDLAFLRGELPLIEAQRAELQATLEACDQARTRARERRRRLAPELDRARELDGRITASLAERERLVSRRAAAREQAQASEAQLAQLDASLAAARERIDGLAAALEARAGLAPLAAYWPHYKSLLHQQLRGLDLRAQLRRRLAELQPRRQRCDEALSEAKLELERAHKQRLQARTRLAKVDRELDARPSLAELRRRQQALDRGRERLAGVQEIRRRYEQAAEQRRELERERADLIIERDHRSAEQRRVAEALAQMEQGFEAAQRELRRLEAIRDLAGHRVDLRGGEACPLCGATEHPAADEQLPSDGEVERRRARVEALLVQRDDLSREQGEHGSRRELANTQIATIARRLGELDNQREAAQRDWAAALGEGPLLPEDGDEEPADEVSSEQLSLLARSNGRGGVLLPAEPGHAEVAPALWAVENELGGRTRALSEERREIETLIERQRALQSRREQADGEHEARQRELREREDERKEVVRELDEAATKLAELDEELRERLSELEDVGPSALAALEDGGEGAPGGPSGVEGPAGGAEGRDAGGGPAEAGFGATLERRGPTLLAELDAAVHGYRAKQADCERTREGLRLLEDRQLELRSQSSARRERCEQLEVELAEFDRALAEHQAARAALLDGRPVAELVRELEAAVELGERDHEAAKDRLAQVERELKVQQVGAHTLSDQVEELRRIGAEASARVAAAIREAGVDEGEIMALLEREELWRDGWASATREAVDAARARLERARVVVGERERVLLEHRDREAPKLEREAAEALRARVEGELAAVRAELFELEHRLRRDREARAAAELLAPTLRERERGAALWGRLRDAIGSASGDKFQKFAQSLTLELLLAQANAQLRELKPRYALARVPMHDLELQLVDHDLGDEVRSIRGLSGGEKFLVSLALALALASLAAESCRIDSLFIDEGFGSLDPHSLDVAVSTLDALQAEGRQIGVISHVPGIAERVGVEIRVDPVASGRSRVRVLGPRGATP